MSIEKPENAEKPADCFGFLTVRFTEAVGYFGGLLTVNSHGRPLEFHCSLPIKPSRAQSILYGASLDDFLIGEQISLAIVGKVKRAPACIFTDLISVLTLRHVHPTPIACLLDVEFTSKSNGENEPSAVPQMSRPHGSSRRTFAFQLGQLHATTLEDYAADARVISQLWNVAQPQIHPHEPFSRIAEALTEANPTTKAA